MISAKTVREVSKQVRAGINYDAVTAARMTLSALVEKIAKRGDTRGVCALGVLNSATAEAVQEMATKAGYRVTLRCSELYSLDGAPYLIELDWSK